MLTFLDRLQSPDLAKLLLRVSLGGMLILHGISKLLGLPDSMNWIASSLAAYHLPGFFAYGVLVGEVVAPVLLIIGLYSRIGGALVVINMLFALALAHTSEIFALTSHGSWAIELQAFFLISGLLVVLLGPGKFAINRH